MRSVEDADALLFDGAGDVRPPGSESVGLQIDGHLSLGELRELLLTHASTIVVHFADPADGRGFSLPPLLRQLGFNGRVVAAGALIPDQFREAMQVGFDAVLVSRDQQSRHGTDDWSAAQSTYLAMRSHAESGARLLAPGKVSRGGTHRPDRQRGARV